MVKRIALLWLVSFFVFNFPAWVAHSEVALQQSPPPAGNDLLGEHSPEILGDNQTSVIRTRTAQVNPQLLQTLVVGQVFHLYLFANADYWVQVQSIHANAETVTIQGVVSGRDDSLVLLSYTAESVGGSIQVGNEAIYLNPTDTWWVSIDEMNVNTMIDESQDDGVLPPSKRAPSLLNIFPPSFLSADDGAIVDVLVIYTDDLAASPGLATLSNYVNQFVQYTNTAYKNSQITQRIDLVGMVEQNYAESGVLNTDLSRLQTQGDGHLDGVLALRNEYHADLVMLLVANDGSSSGTCTGLAYLQDNNPPTVGFQPYAYSAMKGCSFGETVFAHELGHNMGARHDWYVDHGITPSTYAHGHVHIDGTNSWRTIMAYANHCTAVGVSCNRIPYFANPDVLYNGAPTGVTGGTQSNCVAGSLSPNPSNCDADVEQVFDENTTPNHITDSFRTSELLWSGAISTDWFTAGNWTIQEGAPGSTSPANRVPRSIDDVRIPTSPTGGRFPVISSGTATVREILLNTGASLTMDGGILEVYYSWKQEGTSQFWGNNGTVVFKGRFDSSLTSNLLSYFPNLQIGDTSNNQVTLLSDLDVNGNLTLNSGAKFWAGGNTLKVAGNWSENSINTFEPQTSTVILDGNGQALNKITTATVLNENYSAFDSPVGGVTTATPSGWVAVRLGNSSGSFDGKWLSGNISYAPNGANTAGGHGRRWASGTGSTFVSSWLFSPMLNLSNTVDYTISFKYGVRNASDPSNFEVWYGSNQSDAGRTALVGSYNNVTATTWQNGSFDFTVPSEASYSISIGNLDNTITSSTNNDAAVDNILLVSTQKLRFYNLVVRTGGSGASLNAPLEVGNQLSVERYGLLDLQVYDTAVEGLVSNAGGLRQTRTVNASTTHFLHLQNKAASVTRYYGLEVAAGANNLGATTVTIWGQQACSESGNTVLRCYSVSTTNPNSVGLTFWYLDSERNGLNSANLNGYVWNAGWNLLAGSYSYQPSGVDRSVQINGVSSDGTFSLANTTPGGGVGTHTPTFTPSLTPTPTETPTNTPTPTHTLTP
ncbi:MAG TPA: zinc-dependent metalloprotease family protein, partial [Anaerolineales bacterium]|nr:zinc-dependent metalloprotease family protein [Anaerolineales bacterium]